VVKPDARFLARHFSLPAVTGSHENDLPASCTVCTENVLETVSDHGCSGEIQAVFGLCLPQKPRFRLPTGASVLRDMGTIVNVFDQTTVIGGGSCHLFMDLKYLCFSHELSIDDRLIGDDNNVVVILREKLQSVQATWQELELGPTLDIVRTIPVYDPISIDENKVQFSAPFF
jgi:hypothetical protein